MVENIRYSWHRNLSFGIHLGTNYGPFLAAIILNMYEAEFIQPLLRERNSSISLTGASMIYCHKQQRLWELSEAYISCWTWDQRHHRKQHFCFLHGLTAVDRWKRSASHLNLRKLRRFWLSHHKLSFPEKKHSYVFISQLIRYARAWSSYECFILRARQLAYLTGIHDGTMNRHSEMFMFDTRILLKCELLNNMNGHSREG